MRAYATRYQLWRPTLNQHLLDLVMHHSAFKSRTLMAHGKTLLSPLLLLQFIAGVAPSPACKTAADANGDGAVNALDAAIMLQFDAGLFR